MSNTTPNSIKEFFEIQKEDFNYVKTGGLTETYYPQGSGNFVAQGSREQPITTLKRSKTSRDFSDGLQEYLTAIAHNPANIKCDTCGRYKVINIQDRYDFLLCNCPFGKGTDADAGPFGQHTKKSRSYSNISDLTDRHSEHLINYDNQRSYSSDTESTQNSRIIRFRTKM